MKLVIALWIFVSVFGSIYFIYDESKSSFAWWENFENQILFTKIMLVVLYWPAWLFFIVKELISDQF